jgi:hypothetical protein
MRSNVTAAAAAAPCHVPIAPWPVESRGCEDAQSFLDFCAARTVFDPSLNTLINEPAVAVPPNHAFQDVLNFERHGAAMGVIDFKNDEMLRRLGCEIDHSWPVEEARFASLSRRLSLILRHQGPVQPHGPRRDGFGLPMDTGGNVPFDLLLEALHCTHHELATICARNPKARFRGFWRLATAPR